MSFAAIFSASSVIGSGGSTSGATLSSGSGSFSTYSQPTLSSYSYTAPTGYSTTVAAPAPAPAPAPLAAARYSPRGEAEYFIEPTRIEDEEIASFENLRGAGEANTNGPRPSLFPLVTLGALLLLARKL